MSAEGGICGNLLVREVRPAEMGEFLIRAYSMGGQMVYQAETNLDGEFVIPHLDPGNYVVEIYRTYGQDVPKDHEIYGMEQSFMIRVAPNRMTKLSGFTLDGPA